MTAARSSITITLAVWRALFLREALTRISGTRAAWAWLILEPMAHIAFLVFVLTALRHRVIGGIDTTIWVMVGLVAFFMFRRASVQGMGAIYGNRSLFTYRQVRPFDTVLIRAALEGILMLLIGFTAICIALLFDKPVFPSDPLRLLAALLGLWLLGFSLGLVVSVPNELIPEFDVMARFLMTPLYLMSGVIFPISIVPYPYRDWLMYNPVLHGLEAARHGFASYYHVAPGVDLAYLYAFALVLLFLGLTLHVRFAQRLIAE